MSSAATPASATATRDRGVTAVADFVVPLAVSGEWTIANHLPLAGRSPP